MEDKLKKRTDVINAIDSLMDDALTGLLYTSHTIPRKQTLLRCFLKNIRLIFDFLDNLEMTEHLSLIHI